MNAAICYRSSLLKNVNYSAGPVDPQQYPYAEGIAQIDTIQVKLGSTLERNPKRCVSIAPAHVTRWPAKPASRRSEFLAQAPLRTPPGKLDEGRYAWIWPRRYRQLHYPLNQLDAIAPL